MSRGRECRTISPQSEVPNFQDLLSRLDAEHWRVIEELQAEISQLTMRLTAKQIGVGSSGQSYGVEDDFQILPTPNEGTVLTPKRPKGRGHEASGVRSEYPSPERGVGFEQVDDRETHTPHVGDVPGRRIPSLPQVLEWKPMEYASDAQTHMQALPVNGSRWRNRSRLSQGAVNQLDLFAQFRVSERGPDNSALGKAFAVAQAAIEDGEYSEIASSSSVPIWQEPTEGSDNRGSLNSRLGWNPSIVSDEDEYGAAATRYSSFQEVASERQSDLKLTIFRGSTPLGIQYESTNGVTADEPTNSTSIGGSYPKVHLVVNATWKSALEYSPDEAADVATRMRSSDNLCNLNSSSPMKGKLEKSKAVPNLGGTTAILDKLVLHPNNRWRVSWDLLGFLLLLWDLTTIPLQVFAVGTDGFSGAYKSFMHVIAVSSTSFWSLDLVTNMFTGYYSEQGYLRIEFRLVVLRYLYSWFIMDFLLVILDWVTLCLGILAGSDIMRIGKTVARFLRIVRLLRFVKLSSALQDMLDRINSEYIITLVGVAKILIFIIIMNHYIACGWYGLSQMPSTTRTWLDRVSADTPHENNKISYLYFTSLHWSLTQFTPASMEVVPQNAYERGYNVVIIVIGVVAFSSFVSSITGAMTYIRIMNSRKTEQNACLRRFFTERNISQDMACRVWHWSQNTRSARVFKESDVGSLNLLPDRTRRDLRYELHAPVLQAHPMFYHYHYLDLMTFRQICDAATTEFSLKPGQTVFEETKHVDKMFFVLHGCVDYHHTKTNLFQARRLSTRSSQAVTKIQSGSWACEVALWVSQAKMTGEFIGGLSGLYGAELMLLSNRDFLEVTQANPQSMIYLAQYAELFVAECCGNNRMTQSAPYLFFNELDELQELAQRALDKLGALGKSAIIDSATLPTTFEEFTANKMKSRRMTWMTRMTVGKTLSKAS